MDFLADAHDLALRIAPELGARPLYLLGAGEAEAAGIWNHACYGIAFTGGMMSPAHVDAIGDGYRGPGPVIVLDLDAIARDARPGCVDICQQAIFLHELAHILPAFDVMDAPEPGAFADAYRALVAADAATLGRQPGPELDRDHDRAWARRVVHLFGRAADFGWRPYVHDALRTARPYHRGNLYPSLLAAEIEAMRHATFAEIDATDPPEAFAVAWEEDNQFLSTIGPRNDQPCIR